MGQYLGHENQEKDIDFRQSPYYPLLLEFEFEDQNEDLQKMSDIRYTKDDFKKLKNEFIEEKNKKEGIQSLKLNVQNSLKGSSLLSPNKKRERDNEDYE